MGAALDVLTVNFDLGVMSRCAAQTCVQSSQRSV